MTVSIPILFEADAEALRRSIAPHVDEWMLREIAQSDYGRDIDKNYAMLRAMRDDGHVYASEWIPQEVLELVRWSEPDQSGWRPGDEGVRGHWMRAFCCTELLRMAGSTRMEGHISFNETVANLIDSVDALALDRWDEVGGLLQWFALQVSETIYPEDLPLLGIGILSCAARVPGIADQTIIDTCEWILAREKDANEHAARLGHWWHSANISMTMERWREITRGIGKSSNVRVSAKAAEWLSLIALIFEEEPS